MLKVVGIDLNVLEMKTRMPFKYGIATLTVLPHLFVRVELDIDGKIQHGISADGLAPKWFTKNPDTRFRDDLVEMCEMIRSACALATNAAPSRSVFDLWEQIYKGQSRWAATKNLPPLLWNFGISLVERAIIDAFCRAKKVNFATAVRENLLGIDLGRMRAELSGNSPAELLPKASVKAIHARHTVGLSDPITAADIPAAERVDDGLPQALDDCIRAYGLTYFKIKICGDAAKDVARLTQLADVLSRHSPQFVFTLDGNEQYKSIAAFREFWEKLRATPALQPLLSRLLFVEQPLHRDVALSDETSAAMRTWKERPPTIIDESDAELSSLPKALSGGYVGTSHKNCKGVFKSIANACLLEKRRRQSPGEKFLLSGEDLSNVGPVALLQDLAAAATLGVEHLERNGHHYFAGMSMFPRQIQDELVRHHPDVYQNHARGFAAVQIAKGKIDIGSVISAPFGVAPEIDTRQFTPLDKYDSSGLP